MSAQFDELIDGYAKDKVGICHNFLTEALTTHLRNNLEMLNGRELLSPAGTGPGVSKIYDLQIRSDKIYWIDKSSKNIHELEFLQLIEDFISYMNRTCYTGINGYEFHYAIYDTGSFYKRHLDQFRNDTGRKFSLITYLNEDWVEGNGGHLAVYPGEVAGLILPVAGKSVLFKSNELEHEVTPANRPRMSITGWLKSV